MCEIETIETTEQLLQPNTIAKVSTGVASLIDGSLEGNPNIIYGDPRWLNPFVERNVPVSARTTEQDIVNQ